MERYNLYLDECKPNSYLLFFCLGGCIIKEGKEYEVITNQVNKLKMEIFGNTTSNLHEYDIRNAKENIYRIFKNKEKREKFWEGFHKIFEELDLDIMGSAINCTEYKTLYGFCAANDAYHVTLQMIMENFAYYLAQRNATGMIYLEKTDDTEAATLQQHFYQILATGTLYLSSKELQRRLTNINFLTKNDNNIGLQIADFIPNPINRDCSGLPQKEPSLFDITTKKLYDGGVGLQDRFGKRILLGNKP